MSKLHCIDIKYMIRRRNFNVIGERFGRLVVLSNADKKLLPSGQMQRMVICQCDCGNKKTTYLHHILRGIATHCGCVTKVMGGESDSTLARRWKAMVERCYPNAVDKHIYYDRGIEVCKEWQSYFGFKKWALANGFKKHLQIDRIDNSKGYEPSNCRWVTPKENANNKRNTFIVNYKDKSIPFMLLMGKMKKTRTEIHTIRARIYRGWEHEMAINTPVRIGNYQRQDFKTCKA